MRIFFKNLRPPCKRFLSQLFFMFSMLSSMMEHKKAIEKRTPVYFCQHHEFYKFLSILGHFCCFAAYFLLFFKKISWVQKYAWKDVIHTVILALRKEEKNIFILREFCKRTHCPPIVTLALLLFVGPVDNRPSPL